ncbi:MAG: hypothetical protein FRX49_06259 [Trebouxia sp. A1-2]|nr:MAG: hypothetical protein FRX49_06259 [Trebouxia sp. A1-2]
MMFTPSKLFKSVASKVTRRSVQSTPPNGAHCNASPNSPIAAARGAEQESPIGEVFASPTQEIATSQQGTPDDAVNHGRRTSAVGLLQLGSVLAGAAPLQQGQSVTTPRQPDAAQELAVDMPASFEQALLPASDEYSWPCHSVILARQYPLPSKRSAIDDDVDAFLESRQAKRQCTDASSPSQTSDRQLARYNPVRASPAAYPRLPASVSTAGPPFHAVHALPLPSPKPAAAAALPPRGQRLPAPSRFSQQAGSSVAFARPDQGQSAFAGVLPPSANPFSIGANGKRKQETPRFQQHKSARSRLDAAHGGRSSLVATSVKASDAPKYPRFSFGTAQQAPMLQRGQSPIPNSIFPSQTAAFGLPFPALPPSMQPASSSHAQQALWPHPASPQGHASQQTASPQQASGLAAKQSPAGTSSTPIAASMDASGSVSGQSARQDGTATYWTPMKASADLPHQALVDKVTRGKQLLPNSLIGAGLDPVRPASTPRPQGLRRFQGVTPKRKADELESSHEQDVAAEEQGQQKQARTAAPAPAASQQPRTLAFAPPPATLLGFAPSVPATPSSPLALMTSNAQKIADASTASQIVYAVPVSTAKENQTKKDYGAAWMAAAAQNDKATSSPAATADMPSDTASPPITDAAPKGIGQSAHESPVAPLSNYTPPKQRSSLTDSLLRQTPAFPSFTSLPPSAAVSSTPQATPHPSPFPSMIPSSPAAQSVTPTASPLAGSGSTPAASASAPWAISTAHTPPLPWGASRQQPQQQVSTTPKALLNTAAMTIGPSKQAEGQDDGKGDAQAQQTASTSSEGSGETREERLYPFPTHRSAQDRLAGIVSSSPYAEEDLSHQYVFGRRQRILADRNMFGQTTQAVPVPELSKPADGMPGAAQQDGYLSPGEAQRLHTMSTTVPLPSPGLESDSEPEAHEAARDDIKANGESVTPDTDGAASDADWIQTSSIMPISSSNSGSNDSDIDDGSDVSVISGMDNSDDDSIAPTEVVEDEDQDATVVLDAQASAVSGWDPGLLQKHSAAAQEAAAAEAVQKASTAQQQHAEGVSQHAEAAELAGTPTNVSEEVAVQPAGTAQQAAAEPLQASSKASAAAPEEPEASKPAAAGNAPLWQNAQAKDGVQDAAGLPRRRLKVRRNR